MDEETTLPPSRAEARATLADANQVMSQTRGAVAQSMAGPALIWWGLIWMAIFLYAQFHAGPNRLWWVFVLTGFVGSTFLHRCYPPAVKRAPDWRIAGFWLAIFGYMWGLLWFIVPWNLLNNLSADDQQMMNHKVTAYFSIVPMFAYVLIGLWVGRFFVWLGLIVTALILLGYYLLPDYFYLWVGLMGGGALTVSGIFIRKFWK